MSDRQPIEIVPSLVALDSSEYGVILNWPFADADKYVARLLRDDIPKRLQLGELQIWGYHNSDGQLVGFGTIDLSEDYAEKYTAGRPHPYIPLLAVNPAFQGLGHGSSIVKHLIVEGIVLARRDGLEKSIYLDVYVENERAIKMYEKLGFIKVVDEPIPDFDQGGLPYFIMARRTIITQGVLLSITGC